MIKVLVKAKGDFGAPPRDFFFENLEKSTILDTTERVGLPPIL